MPPALRAIYDEDELSVGLLGFLKGRGAKQPRVEPKVTVSVTFSSASFHPQEPAKDLRKAECPYCHGQLKKIPGRKTTCPHCGQDMYVRTKPDNTRVVVTSAEAEKIEEAWAVASGTHDQYIAGKERVAQEREVLGKRFAKEPSEDDVQWSILNKDLVEHGRHRNWGHYRNTRFQMAEILRKESRLLPALETYLEVCYLDLNGPNNTGGHALSSLRDFDPGHDASLAPGVLDRVAKLVKKLQLDRGALRETFLAHNRLVQVNLRLPLSAELCWEKLSKVLPTE